MERRAIRQVGPSELRVLSYNIHHGADTEGAPNLDAQAAVIREARPDVVLLQEVDRFTKRSGNVDQVEYLRKATGLDHFAFGKNLDYDDGLYGNAILSSFELQNVTNHLLPIPSLSKEPRSVLVAQLGNIGQLRHVLSTHFPLQPIERVASVGFVIALLGQLPGPAIFGGDLNAGMHEISRRQYNLTDPFEDPAVVLLREFLDDGILHASHSVPGTYPSDQPQTHLDFLFLKNGKRAGDYTLGDFSVLHSSASDHRPVLAVLRSDLALLEQGNASDIPLSGD